MQGVIYAYGGERQEKTGIFLIACSRPLRKTRIRRNHDGCGQPRKGERLKKKPCKPFTNPVPGLMQGCGFVVIAVFLQIIRHEDRPWRLTVPMGLPVGGVPENFTKLFVCQCGILKRPLKRRQSLGTGVFRIICVGMAGLTGNCVGVSRLFEYGSYFRGFHFCVHVFRAHRHHLLIDFSDLIANEPSYFRHRKTGFCTL